MGTRASNVIAYIDATSSFGVKIRIEKIGLNIIEVAVSSPRNLSFSEENNILLQEICNQFEINHTFTVAYHPASNGLVERANLKILEVLRPVVGSVLHSWEDWLRT